MFFRLKYESESGTRTVTGIENPTTSAEEKERYLEPLTELQKVGAERRKVQLSQKDINVNNDFQKDTAVASERNEIGNIQYQSYLHKEKEKICTLMSTEHTDSLNDQTSMSSQNYAFDEKCRNEIELKLPKRKGEGDAASPLVGFGSQDSKATCLERANRIGILGNEHQPEGNKDKDNKKEVTSSACDTVNRTNTEGKEQIPQKTKDEDNVTKATDSGSQKTLNPKNDYASWSTDLNEESDSEDDNVDLMNFVVILNGICTNIVANGEHSLKWRFLFDCPHTKKEICDDPGMVGTRLEYRKGTVHLTNLENHSSKTFKAYVEELLHRHVKQVQVCQTVIPDEAVLTFLGALQLVELCETKMVIVYKRKTNLYLCGKKEHLEEPLKHVTENKKLAFRLISETVTEKIQFKEVPLQLIKKWMEIYMSANTSNIQYKFQEDQKYLQITGLEIVIIKEKVKLQNLLGSITKRRLKPGMCAKNFSIFEELKVVKYIEGILKEQKLVCIWETNKDDCQIVVTAFDELTCEKAYKVINAACVIESKSLQVDATTRILPNTSWEQNVSFICTWLGGRMKMWLDKTQMSLEYVYTQDIGEIVKHEVQDLVSNCNREKHIPFDKRVVEKLEKEEQKLRKLEETCNVTVSFSKNIEKMGLFIVGRDSNIQLALDVIKKECTMIMKPDYKPAKSRSGCANWEMICVPDSHEKHIVMLKDKSCFHCNKAELKDRETDTEIVEITPKFSLTVNLPAEVKADMILPTDKSKRPVIFLCPKWEGGNLKEKQILYSVLNYLFEFLSSLSGQALLEIEDQKTGNWPSLKFVKLILFTYQKYLTANTTTELSRLFLLMKDDKLYDNVKETVSTIIYWDKKSHSKDNSEISQKQCRVMSKTAQISSGTKVLEVIIVKDQLTHRKADVLVNTADPELKLEYGRVSKSIYDATGEGIRIECKSRYPNGIKPGQVAVTGAYRLSGSKFIFHGTFENWNPKMEKKLKSTLKEFVILCLQMADKEKMKSIAFPAIGTGILNYPSVVVADCMFEAVEEYIQTRPAFLQQVYFVIYGKDTKMVLQAFDTRKKIHDQKIKGSHVGQESPCPSGGAESMRKPTNQENNSL